MDNKELLAYRKRLLAGGVRPALVRRHVQELREHAAGLREAALLQGLSAQEAAAAVTRQLGTPEQLATAMLARPELRSRWHRHPVLLLILLPLLGYVLLYVASIFGLLAAGAGLHNLIMDTPMETLPAWVPGAFAGLRFVLHYVVLLLLIAAIAVIGIRQHVPTRCWLTGLVLACILGSSADLYFAAPDRANQQPGTLGVGLTFAPHELATFNPASRRDHNFRLLLNLLAGGSLAWYLRRREQEALEALHDA